MEPVLGIDLGTTNSVVAVYRAGRAEVLRGDDGDPLLPSVVGLDDQGGLLVGTPARNQYVLFPDRTVRSIKRLMGQDTQVRMGPREYAPQEISAIILGRLKERAAKALGGEVRKAVITVPAFFNEVQREATRQAGELAGLDVVRIINEPTAASLVYEPHPERRERIMVYDLGGGTFDVSIVDIEQGVVEVLSSHGDTRLGGDDFDQLLMEFVSQRFLSEHQVDLQQSPPAKARLLRAVEEAKKSLSFGPLASISEEFIAERDGLPLHLSMEIRRDEYEDMIQPMIMKTLDSVHEALASARLSPRDIDRVVLVGGMTRTPLIQRLLAERVERPIHAEVDPDLGVALGAAIQAAMIAGEQVGPVLVDISPHTLGIQALGDMDGMPSVHCFSPIIPRNTPLPATRSQLYTTAYDGQDAAQIAVYQGELPDVRSNQLVGEFLLDGLADVEQGNEVLVRFDLDLDGILKVSAVERATGRARSLVIDNAARRFSQRGIAPLTTEELGLQPATMIDDDVSLATGGGLEADDDRATQLMARARAMIDRVNAVDAADLRAAIDRLAAALSSGSHGDTEGRMSELEDLVFYLQDA